MLCADSIHIGHGHVEDIPAMLGPEPVLNAYWQDKRADFSKIKVPAYVLASYSTGLHTEGSLRFFEETTQPAWYVASPCSVLRKMLTILG
jgi:predicted acyl esterase